MASKYDLINRFKDYADSNHWRDTDENRWRKVERSANVITQRGSHETGAPIPDGIALTDSRKPYSVSGDYGDMMDSVTRSGIQALHGKEAFSERDKPYATDKDYQEIEHLQPELWNSTPWVSPGIKRPGFHEQETPGAPLGCESCTLTGHFGSPYHCGEVLWAADIHATEYCTNTEDFSGSDCKLQIEVLEGRLLGNIPGDLGRYINRHLLFDPSIENHKVKATMVDGYGNECTYILSQHCVQCDCEDPDLETLAIDGDLTADTIAPGGTADIYWTGGCSPYTIAGEGTGYSSSWGETDGNYVTISCVSGVCGVDYSAIDTVNITDDCGNTITKVLRNTSGDWVLTLWEEEAAWDGIYVLEITDGQVKYEQDWCASPCVANCQGGPLAVHTDSSLIELPEGTTICHVESSKTYEWQCS